jgi:hypothetical protein
MKIRNYAIFIFQGTINRDGSDFYRAQFPAIMPNRIGIALAFIAASLFHPTAMSIATKNPHPLRFS